MAERIDHSAQAPPMHFLHREDLSGPCGKRLREHRIRIRHGQDHPRGTAAQRLRTEVAMLGGLVTQPKLRTINGQLGMTEHATEAPVPASALIVSLLDHRRPVCGWKLVESLPTLPGASP